jgi:hypothetical protein
MDRLRLAIPSSVPNIAVSLFLSGILCLAVQSAKADTFTFLDSTDTLSIQSSSGVTTVGCSGETCNLTINPPSGYSFDSYTGPGLQQAGDYFLGIAEPGVALPTTHFLSDEISVFPPSTALGPRQVTFGSDTNETTLNTCTNIIVVDCQVTETGGVQFGVTINWRNNSTGAVDKTDTINFHSDVETPTVPEPGTLVLFGSGLVSIVGFARRKTFQT